MLRALFYLLIVALTLWAFIDVAQTRSDQVAILPKVGWLVLTLVPLGGPALWFLFGRAEQVPARGSRPPGRAQSSRPQAPLGPDDDPEFLRRLGGGRPDNPS